MLMDNLSSAVTEEKLLAKMDVLRLEKEAILNSKPLWEKFREASKKVEYVTEDNKRNMFELLVKKTIHAVFEDAFKTLCAKHTSRGTRQNITGQAFRDELKGMTRSKKSKDVNK
jgi:hypothetical protein